MSLPKRRMDFSNVNVAQLETDDDFRREAQRQLPKQLEALGRFAAEEAWKGFEKGFRGTGMKLKSSEKQKFIRDAAAKVKRTASAKEKQELLNNIIEQLRAMKSK